MHTISRILFCVVVAVATARAEVMDGDLTVNSFNAYAGQTNIVLQATRNITFTGGTLNLPPLPPGAASGLLTVEAGNDVVVNDGVTIIAGTGWSVAIDAGVTNFEEPPAVIPGNGNITFQGTASLVAAGGSINLQAGNNIMSAGGVIGSSGGDIFITALMGSVSIGSGGQIGAVGNGSISISAGGDISGIIEGTVTNLTAGGVIVIAGSAVPINGGVNCPFHCGNACLYRVHCPNGIFYVGCGHNQFMLHHFTRPPVSRPRQLHRAPVCLHRR